MNRVWAEERAMQSGGGKDVGRATSSLFPGASELERSNSFSSFIAVERAEGSAPMAAATEQLLSARRRTFTGWLNLRLRGSKLRVEELERDLASGVVLVRLLQTFSPHDKALGKLVKKPNKPTQKLQNLALAFDHLQREGVSLLGIDPNDIVQQDLDQVLALLWAIICHYLLRQGDSDGERALLEWLRSAVQDPKIQDLASSWNDGVNLSALVDYCQPGLIPDHASLDPERRLENVRRAMELAEQHLQVPQLMHPEDLAVDKPDKLSTVTYLSQFCCPNSVGERNLLEFIHKKLPNHNITNFTTDWVNGRVLGALTGSVCEYDPPTTHNNPTERCSEAMMAAESHLFVRKILETSEFINPELDPRLRMAYLTELQRASQPPRILDILPPEMAGVGREIVVDVEVPGHGKMEASAVGAISGVAGVKVESPEAGHTLFKVAALARDQYTVTITHSGRVIRGCPFVVTLDAYSIPHTGTSMPKKIGDPCKLTFDTLQVGGKPVEVKVGGKSSGEVGHTMDTSNPGLSTLSFTPRCLDTYTVTLAVEGKEVKESPFLVHLLAMVDPGKVVCGDVISSGVDSPVNLAVDCRSAGEGNLTASCTGQRSGDLPLIITTSDDAQSTVSFSPGSADLFLLRVLYEGAEVPGSPWCIDFRALPPLPGKVKVVNTPTGRMEVGKLLSVDFDAVNAGSGHLTASCSGAACGDVPVSIVTTGFGKFQVGFIPTVPDNYFVMVCWAGSPVHGSPFQVSLGCEPVNSSKCRVVGLAGNPALVKVRNGYQGLIGQQVVLQVKTEGAGEAKLEVKIQSPSKKVFLSSQPSPDDPKTHVIRYTPLTQGQYCVQLLWGGSPIPASPIRFDAVSPLEFPLGGPITAELELDGKKKDLNGEAVLQKEGLPEKIAATVEKATNKKVVLSLDPTQMEQGTYILYAYSKYKELPNSPLVLVYGARETDSQEESDTIVLTETDAGSASLGENGSTGTASVVVQEREMQVPELAVVIDTSVLETTPSPTETLTTSNTDVSPSPRDRSYTTDLPQDRGHLLDSHQRSHSVGQRPEVAKTTTPINTETTFHMPEPEDKGHEPTPIEPQQSLELVVEIHTSPPLGDSAPPEAALPQESAHLPDTSDSSRREEVMETETELAGSAAIAEGEKPEETEMKAKSEKKSKKSKEKEEEKKLKKEKEKAEKAEKAKKEKEEKKKKKEKKEAGLDLENQEFRVGIKMKYKLHCEALGSKSPGIICSPPEAAKHSIIPAPQFGKNTYWCELIPTRVGQLEVSIVYEDFHILGSPFSVSVDPRGDASQCTMVETASTCRQELENSLLFCIDVPQSAGQGKLTASVKSGATSKRISGVRASAVTEHHYHVEFVPSEGLEYILSVKYDERHIKGSPFVINLGDPAKCKIRGEGLKQAHIDEENTFEIDGTEAGPGELSVEIEREGKPVEAKITVTGDQQYRISYAAQKPGLYRVAVRWGDGHVKHSPFEVSCISASQFSIAEGSLHRTYAGATSSFQVVSKAPHIRQKQLSIFAHPQSDISKMFSGEIVREGESTFTCSLRPTEAHVGLCNMHICWNGREIHGSPYEVSVEAPPCPTDFSLYAVETESGDIAVDVSGPVEVFASENLAATAQDVFTEEQVEVKVTKVSNERTRIQLLPTAGGEYQLSILFAGNHIANSPFFLTQSDPSKCLMKGEGLRVSRVNELTKFTVDHSQAGLGHLKVDIEGEGGRIIEPFIASGDTLSEVSYISRQLGVYSISAQWGEHKFPDGPFTMHTVDPSKFSMKGPLPKRLPVNQALQFEVIAGVPVEKCERLSVTAKLIHQQQIYRGAVESKKSRREQSFLCSLEIPREGQFAIYVQCRGLDITGSPFKIKMMPAPRPERVKVSGPGLKGGVVGERQRFSIDVGEAGFGNIQLKVQGPRSRLSIDMHRHKTSKRVITAEYTPEYPGKYTIHVSWAGLVVPGSPYSVNVRDCKKREEAEGRDREWKSLQSSPAQLIQPVH